MGETTLGGKLDLAPSFDAEEAYDPLEFIEGGEDEDWMDDDGLLLPNPLPAEAPQPRKLAAVHSPERAGSVAQSVRDLVTVNAARRNVLLSIVDWAREGQQASVLFRKIEQLQADNLSVYEPVSYCRMLERAGALRLELCEAGAAAGEEPPGREDACAEGMEYLSIEEEVDPVWRSTDEGLAVYEELVQGTEWREKVLGSDRVYAEVYLSVMNALRDEGKSKADIAALAEAFEVTKEPLKYGAYFIDVLEATSAIQWRNMTWNLTDLGRRLLPELAEACRHERHTTALSGQEA